jgi:hypothetical protein
MYGRSSCTAVRPASFIYEPDLPGSTIWQQLTYAHSLSQGTVLECHAITCGCRVADINENEVLSSIHHSKQQDGKVIVLVAPVSVSV